MQKFMESAQLAEEFINKYELSNNYEFQSLLPLGTPSLITFKHALIRVVIITLHFPKQYHPPLDQKLRCRDIIFYYDPLL